MSCRGVNKTLCRSEQDYMYRILPKASSSIGSSCPTRRHRLFLPFFFFLFPFFFGAFNSVNLEGGWQLYGLIIIIINNTQEVARRYSYSIGGIHECYMLYVRSETICLRL